MSDERCAICGHHKSQHLSAPRACADCMRENRDGAFHAYAEPTATPESTSSGAASQQEGQT